MCYILCMTSSSVCYVALSAHGFFLPQEMCRIFASFFVSLRFSCPLLGGFSAHGFCHGFLFSVKEEGLLTNPGHWVRFLDVVGSYMYIVL
jgi:hypothetical protein